MVQTILSLAKTTRPTLSLVVNRERLYAELAARLDAAKAVWVVGPPGAGKTTLVAGYVASRQRLALWYQLDNADSDVATFLYYLRQTTLKHTKASPAKIPEMTPTDERDWANYARRMFRALFSCCDDKVVFVFDNHEEIPRQSDLHDLLALVIDETPPGRGVIFISRGEPPAALARARVNQSLQVLPADILRINAEECAQISAMRGAALKTENLANIQATSDGWVAGVILLIEHNRHKPDELLAGTADEVLYDYIAREVFSQFDSRVQHLMLTVCWPRRLSLSLAEKISGDAQIRQVLINLARNNYFVTERDETGEREYIFHPLLRKFLQKRALEAFNARALSTLQLRTAELLLEVGYIEEAVEIQVANLDWTSLEAVILRFAPLLVSQARLGLLRSWLEELPHEKVERNGWLTYWLGIAMQRESARSCRQLLQAALQFFAVANDRRGLARTSASLIERIIEDGDDYSLLDPVIATCRLVFDGHAAEWADDLDLPALSALILGAFLRKPELSELDAWLAVRERMLRDHDDGTLSQIDLLVRVAQILGGDLEGAEIALSKLNAHPREAGNVLQQTRLSMVASLHGLFLQSPTRSLENWRRTLELAEGTQNPRLVRFAHLGLAVAGLMANAPIAVSESLRAIEFALEIDDRLFHCLGYYVRSWAALCTGDSIGAFHLQKKAVAQALEIGVPFLEVLCRTALAQILFLCRDTRGGTSQLRRVHAVARDIRNPMLEYLTLLVYGDVAVRENRLQSGINALRYAFGLGRQHGYFNLPWWQRQRLTELCVIAIKHDIEVEFVSTLIRRHEMRPKPPPVALKQWPWDLRITSFGGLTLAVNELDEPDATCQLGQGRPAQLLRLIVASGRTGLGTEMAAEAIWPKIELEYALKSLTINLHRLRRQLGRDEFVLLRDGLLTMNLECVWTDVCAFEELLLEIGANRRGRPVVTNEKVAHGQFEKLLQLYRGAWLANDCEIRAYESCRARLQAAFVEAVEILLESNPWRDDAKRAVAMLERAIERAPMAEPLYCLLMKAELAAGNPELALSAYRRCSHVLDRLGSAPSPRVEALRLSIVNAT